MNTEVREADDDEQEYGVPGYAYMLVLNDSDATHGHPDGSGLWGHGFPCTLEQLATLRDQIVVLLATMTEGV